MSLATMLIRGQNNVHWTVTNSSRSLPNCRLCIEVSPCQICSFDTRPLSCSNYIFRADTCQENNTHATCQYWWQDSKMDPLVVHTYRPPVGWQWQYDNKWGHIHHIVFAPVVNQSYFTLCQFITSGNLPSCAGNSLIRSLLIWLGQSSPDWLPERAGQSYEC